MSRGLRRAWLASLAFVGASLVPAMASAAEGGEGAEADLVSFALVLLLPMLLVAASAFAKVSVTLALLRNAFASSEVPPALVVTALAFVISLVVLFPVGAEMVQCWGDAPLAVGSVAEAQQAWARVSPPLLDFLAQNSSAASVARFEELLGAGAQLDTSLARLAVLLPAYLVTELTEAFTLGLLLLLPFVVLDLVVASVLQAAGLGAVQPHVVALPVKLGLFVAIDGWTLVVEALLASYG